MVLVIFLVLLAFFVILPIFGVLVWFLISTAITGFVLGGLARLIIPGRQPIGVLATIVSGWIGSLVGTIIGTAAFGYHHHWFAKILIEIGVSAVAVLAWSAGARHSAVEPGHHGHHKIIDV
jgi:uncharacterized membrane protein YeaQ/YmgE (transglycosylase-associated protein family)